MFYSKNFIVFHLIIRSSTHGELAFFFFLYTGLELCLVSQSCLTLVPQGSCAHGSLQARILEWVTVPSSYSVREHSNSILLALLFSQYYLLKRLSFLHCILLPPLSYINWPKVCGFIYGLSIMLYQSICLFLCRYHTVLMTIVLWYTLKSILYI